MTLLILWFILNIQYEWEPVLIQQILIGFEAILENRLKMSFKAKILFNMLLTCPYVCPSGTTNPGSIFSNEATL